MSLFESGHSNGMISLKDICLGKAIDAYIGDLNLDTILEYILVGGWPSAIDLNYEQGLILAKEYMKSVLNEDIHKVDFKIRDKKKAELLFKSLARNESTTSSKAAIIKDIKEKDFDYINVDTITDYLGLTDRLYLTNNIPPFSSNIRSSLRVKQNEKRHFVDPSITSAILSLTKKTH